MGKFNFAAMCQEAHLGLLDMAACMRDGEGMYKKD